MHPNGFEEQLAKENHELGSVPVGEEREGPAVAVGFGADGPAVLVCRATVGPDYDHLQALRQIIDRIPQRIVQAPTVAEKLDLGRAGRMLSRAYWACWDPQGVQDVIDRELVMAMPWLAGSPAPLEMPDGWLT